MNEISIPKPGDVWQHYKGGFYEVIGVATDVETQRQQVIYRSNDGRLFSRCLGRWSAVVTLKGGAQVQRFVIVSRTVEQEDRLPHEDSQPAPPRCQPVQQDTGTVAP